MKRPLRKTLVISSLISAVTFGGSLAEAAQLISHQAVYDTTVVPVTNGADITVGKGRFVLEWQRECEGYSTKQRMVADYVPVAGPAFNQDVHVRLWEDARSHSMSFHNKHLLNGREIEVFSGKADDDGIQAEGRDVQELPDQTLFPTAELSTVVDKAKAGEKFINYWSFDGSDDGLSRRSVLVLGEAKDAETRKSFPVLQPLKAWRMRLAGHLPGQEDQKPHYEMAVTLYDNGVASVITYDYGSWKMVAKLVNLKVLDEPKCD